MSDETEKKPKDKKKTEKVETKTADTAPNIKQQQQTASSKSNAVMPVVLLLVSAIVIVATIYKYKDEQSNLQLQSESQNSTAVTSADKTTTEAAVTPVTDNQTTMETEAVAQSAEVKQAAIEQTEEKQTSDDSTAAAVEEPDSETQPDSVATAASDNNTEAAATAETGEHELRRQQFDERIAEMQARSEKNRAEMLADDSSLMETRKAAIAEARERARKRYESMMQQRQQYETEMAARHQQYEAMKKAQLKRAPETAQARDAERQRLEQIRTEAKKQVDARMKRIAELQDEIRQIIYESRMQFRGNAEESAQPRLPAAR